MQEVEILDFHNLEIDNADVLHRVSQCFSKNRQDRLSVVIIRNPYDFFEFQIHDLISKKSSILFTQDIIESMKKMGGKEFLGWLKRLNFFPFYDPQVVYLDNKKRLIEAIECLECFDYVVPYDEIDLFKKNISVAISITRYEEEKLIFSLGESKMEAKIFIEKDLVLYDKALKLWREIKNNNFKPLESAKVTREKFLNKEQTKDKYKGILGRITSNSIIGWAMKKGEKECVTIEIYKNGKLLRKAKADQMRQDIKQRGIHPTGQCGFFVTFDHPTFTNGDLVKIKIIPDNVILDMGLDAVSFLNAKN